MTYTPPSGRPVVVVGGNVGLAPLVSLLTALATEGRITDSTSGPQAPNVPSSQAASGVGPTTFIANWAPSVIDSTHDAAVSYQLDVATNSGFTAFFSGFNNLNVGNVTSYLVSGLSQSSAYWYRVRAVNAASISANSSTQTLTTTAAPITQTLTTSPLSGSTNLINPLMGEYTWYGQSSPSGLTNVDAYDRYQWTDVEGGQGSYNFAAIDAGVSTATSKGGRYGFGIMMVNEGAVQRAYPNYISGGWTWTDPGTGGALDIPDWNGSSYLNAFDNLMSAIANHTGPNGIALKNDPHLGWIDLMGFGNWGEWHTYGSSGNWGSGPGGQAEYLTQTNLARVVATNFNNFPNCMISAFTDNSTELNYVLGLNKRAGVTIKCLGNSGLGGDSGTAQTNPCFSNWQNGGPMWGEWCNNTGDASTFLSQVSYYHYSMIGTGNNPSPDPRTTGTFAQAVRLMGYRILLDSLIMPGTIPRGSPFTVTTSWENVNVAPSWLGWTVQVQLRPSAVSTPVWTGTSGYDLRTLVPTGGTPVNYSDTFTVPTSVASGTYRVVVKVVDPQGVSSQLNMGITGQQSDGSYNLGSVIVT